MNQNRYRIVSVDPIILIGKKIVLTKRAVDPYNGCWVLPGGRIEMNETVEQACMREAKEETGLKVKIVKMTGVYSSPKRDPRGTVAVAFLCSGKGKLRYAKEEASGIKLFDLEKLPKRLGFDHKKIIADAVSKKN
ncbi:MAG: NUDIX hydrolase [Candidatus Diapherotrites archaeon]